MRQDVQVVILRSYQHFSSTLMLKWNNYDILHKNQNALILTDETIYFSRYEIDSYFSESIYKCYKIKIFYISKPPQAMNNIITREKRYGHWRKCTPLFCIDLFDTFDV